MLNFFRKYQKIFFVFVTFFIVVSFAFFGTFKAYTPKGEVHDKVLGKALDGSPILEREIAAIGRLLTTDTKKAGMPNFLHGDFFAHHILKPGLGASIANHFFPLFENEFSERLEKVHVYQPYAHPDAPFINSLDVWTKFAPKVKGGLDALKKENKATPETFAHLATLYQEQANLSPDFVKKMLTFQQKQYSWLTPDPTLEQRNLGLFGFETVRDWFGQSFIDVAAQVILNGAALAKEKGMSVDLHEARGDLLHNVIQSAERNYGQTITLDEAAHYLRQEAQMLGLEEKGAVEAWQKVVLFRRYLEGATENLYQDTLFADNFASFANETAQVELFELPLELRFSSFYDLVKFQIYLQKRAPNHGARLDLPTSLLDVAEVEKTCPELVEERMHLEWSEVDVGVLALSVPLRATWDWEGEHWNTLIKEFPSLEKAKVTTPDERLAHLDTLDEKERLDIDQFARIQIVKSHPEQVTSALQESTPRNEWLSFRMQGDVSLPFKGIKKASALVQLLKEKKGAERYTEDGVHFLTARLLEEPEAKSVLSFSKAKSDPAFVAACERLLEAHYKKTQPNATKPLKEVRDDVGASYIAPVLRALEKAEKMPEGKIEPAAYVKVRLAPFVRAIKSKLEKGEDVSAWIEGEGNTRPYVLKKRQTDVTRSRTEGFNPEELFALKPGAFSVLSSHNAFCRLVSFGKPESKTLAELGEKGKTLLADEAKRGLFEELAVKLKEKNIIVAPKKEEE